MFPRAVYPAWRKLCDPLPGLSIARNLSGTGMFHGCRRRRGMNSIIYIVGLVVVVVAVLAFFGLR
jgi:hypothetical protein